MAGFTEQIERIKKKIPKAKKADKGLKVFGAGSHQYVLHKPATNQEVKAFEQEHGIQLPECFKAFVLNIGNGGISYYDSGAGPYYGIYGLGENMDDLFSNAGKYLKNECLLRPGITDKAWKELNRPIDEKAKLSDNQLERYSGKIFGGILPIGSQGCTYLHGIVLNGPHTGKVVNLCADRQRPKFTFEQNFLDWYERWLDEVISGELISDEVTWFGYIMGGTEEELLHKFLSAKNNTAKTDALNGLLSKKNVSDKTFAALEKEFTVAKGTLKEVLLQAITKFNYKKAKPHLTAYAATSLLPVLRNIYFYAKDKSAEWYSFIKANMYRVNDEENFRYCTYLLQETKKDYGSLIVLFATHKNEQVRVTTIELLGQLPNKKYSAIITHALNDGSPNVIRTALQALPDTKNSSLLKQYKKIAERFTEDEEYVLSNLDHKLAAYGLNHETIKGIDPDQITGSVNNKAAAQPKHK